MGLSALQRFKKMQEDKKKTEKRVDIGQILSTIDAQALSNIMQHEQEEISQLYYQKQYQPQQLQQHQQQQDVIINSPSSVDFNEEEENSYVSNNLNILSSSFLC